MPLVPLPRQKNASAVPMTPQPTVDLSFVHMIILREVGQLQYATQEAEGARVVYPVGIVHLLEGFGLVPFLEDGRVGKGRLALVRVRWVVFLPVA